MGYASFTPKRRAYPPATLATVATVPPALVTEGPATVATLAKVHPKPAQSVASVASVAATPSAKTEAPAEAVDVGQYVRCSVAKLPHVPRHPLPVELSWRDYDAALDRLISADADPLRLSRLQWNKAHGDVVEVDGRRIYTMGRY